MKLSNYYKEQNYIHYSNCHEDYLLLEKYLPKNAKNVLSVASGLDNSLSFLVHDNLHVYAFDFNPSQIALAKLKIEAIKEFNQQEYLEFIGVKNGDKLALYEKIKNKLDEKTKDYFNSHLFLIEVGLVDCGRFEQYFHLFRKKVFPRVSSEYYINKFSNALTLEEQVKIYNKKIDTLRFKLMFKIFFSKRVMAKRGRDKEFFKYSKTNLPKMLHKRVRLGFENNLNRTNPYLNYVLKNKYDQLPFYMEEENYNKIKKNINNIEVFNKTFDEMLDRKYDFMNLSDIFEYMENSKMEYYEPLIFNSLEKGGRVAFWNMMNERKLSLDPISTLEDIKNDRAFFYRGYYCYEK